MRTIKRINKFATKLDIATQFELMSIADYKDHELRDYDIEATAKEIIAMLAVPHTYEDYMTIRAAIIRLSKYHTETN